MLTRRLFTLAAVLMTAASAPAGFLTTNATEHSDIAFFYEGGRLSVGVTFEDRTPEEEYAAGEVLHSIDLSSGRVTLPAGFNFLGATGSTAYVIPQSHNPNLPFVGIGAEELDEADFGGPLHLTFNAVRGPGDFAVWQNDEFGGDPNLFFSTLTNGVGSIDTAAGGHNHYNFGFTAPGLYEIDVTGTGRLADGTELSSGATTLFFGVGPVAVATPAPPAVLLFAAGTALLGCGGAIRRRLA